MKYIQIMLIYDKILPEQFHSREFGRQGVSQCQWQTLTDPLVQPIAQHQVWCGAQVSKNIQQQT